MNLRFVWHIVRKDARRLWWMIALTLALLARLAHFDSIRAYGTPGSDEGWLNILLPLAWSFLIALAVMEDPVVADTPFWATVPCRWPSLLAAKAALVAIAIHAPYFAACVYILQARGFSPFEYLTALLYKQFALLMLTAGSLALASVVRNVTQFMVVAIALATAMAAPTMAIDYYGDAIQHVREIFAFPVVTIVAAWIAIVQYGRRSTSVSRVVGIAAIAMVGMIWWLPRERFYGIQAAMNPAPASASEISVHLSAPPGNAEEVRGRNLPLKFDKASVAVPIVASGLRDNTHATLLEPRPQFHDASGNRYTTERTGGPRDSITCCRNLIPSWQIIAIDPAIYERIKELPLKLPGRLYVEYYQPTEPVPVPIGATRAIAGLGRCSTELPAGYDQHDEVLRVECELPNTLPPIQVKLSDQAGHREWNQYLGGSRNSVSYPADAWLSPVNRAATTFSFTDEENYRAAGAQWLVPREIEQSIGIAVKAELPEGIAIVPYELPIIKLSQYAVKP